MNEFTIGDFDVQISGPYPCRIELYGPLATTDGGIMFDHRHLADLEYVVARLKREARQMLPESDRHEV